MNLKKKSLIFTCLAGLACVVGTGFAAWTIITNSEETVSGGGNLKADTVTKSSGIKISGGEWYKGNVKQSSGVTINFGADTSGVNSSNIWFANNNGDIDDGTGVYSYKFNVAVIGNVTSIEATEPTITVDTTKQEAWENVKTKNLITANAKVVSPKDSVGGEYSIDVTFGWGSAFGNENPFKFYNDGSKDAASYGSQAEANLELISKLNGATFAVSTTLTAK